MTWISSSLSQVADLIGSDGWIAAMGVLFFFGVSELIHRAVTGYRRVPHYKLRATAAHLYPQSDVPEAVVLGSTAPSVESQPASPRGAGTNPTPPRTGLAAGHEEPRDTAVAVGDPDRDVDTPPTGIPVSASPHQRSAAAVFPDTAAAGLPPRPGATPGGAGPSVVAADGPARAVA